MSSEPAAPNLPLFCQPLNRALLQLERRSTTFVFHGSAHVMREDNVGQTGSPRVAGQWSPELAMGIAFVRNPAEVRQNTPSATRNSWCWATPCDRYCTAEIRTSSPSDLMDEGDPDVVMAIPQPGARCPDFSGVWLCVEVTGDSNRFLEEMGVEEEFRRDAAKNHFGVHQQRQRINQNGVWFEIANELKAQVKTIFRAGGGVQSCRDHSGRQTFIDPKWDVASLSLLVRSYSASMEFLAETRRYLTDGDMKRMVVEITSPRGTTVKRIFELEPGEGNGGGAVQ